MDDVVSKKLTDLGGLSGAVLSSALSSAGVAVVITSPDLDRPGPIIQYVNPCFEEMTGYAASELVGRSPRLLQGPETDTGTLARLRINLSTTQHFSGVDINYRKNGERYAFEWAITPLLDNGRITHWMAVQRDVTPHRQALQQVSGELQHRTRNLLGVVRSMAQRTLREGDEKARFNTRLSALSRVQTALSSSQDDRLDLQGLIAAELRSFGALTEKVQLRGPSITLPRTVVETLVLVINELASNACARSLTMPDGRVSATWLTQERAGLPFLVLRWRENGLATEMASSVRSGFGRELIERALPFTLRAMSRLEFGPDCLVCDIDLPLEACL